MQGDGLAVEEDLARGEGLDGLDQLGHGSRDLVAAAGVDADLVPRLVDLDAGAVELELQRGLAQTVERLGDVPRRLREHRLERPEELEPEAREPGPALGQHGPRHLRQPARQHERPAHLVRRHLRRGGQRLGHEAREGPLAELAEDQAHEEILLLAGGAGEKAGEEPAALGRGAGAGRAGETLEGGVHLAQGERGLGGDRLRHGAPDDGAAQADPPLAELAGEEGHGDVDLLGGEPPQEVAQRGDLLQAGSGLGDPAGGGDEVGEAHARPDDIAVTSGTRISPWKSGTTTTRSSPSTISSWPTAEMAGSGPGRPARLRAAGCSSWGPAP